MDEPTPADEPPPRRPAVRIALLVAGFALMLVAPLAAPLPGPGATFLFLGGLALVLRNSTWAKRVFVRFKKRWPRIGRFADWGMRRPSAARRRALARGEQPD